MAVALSRLSMGSVAHVGGKNKGASEGCSQACSLGSSSYEHIRQRCNSSEWAKSSLVVEVKEKQEIDPILLELKGAVNNERVEVMSQGGDGVLRYQGRLCVLDVGELR